MKTYEDYGAFLAELRALCDRHGIGIVGTCESEGIYGEIALFDKEHPESSGWKDPLSEIDGELYARDGTYYISGA